MGKTSFEIIVESGIFLREKNDPCFIPFANLLNKYRDHILDSPEGEAKSAEDFLSGDNLLKITLEAAHCYEDAIHVMESFAKEL